ncbi:MULTISPECIES: hypothetical protein [unclassified Streptomyces]|uniref:hypothetical protein n=1 Tax=unclassified Streptomyces TaxID=2593676 RepID=UPI00081F5D00|nr:MULTISPECIES: hypothetical protein [unclassified Streptomyces]SCG03459.1 hypothetical protein GA0115259_108368 [Streptomyces sp. MnatMP-M17]
MDGLTFGMVVYDRAYEMPGRVTGFAGNLVRLARPTGLTWSARRTSVRPATAWEMRQLTALARLRGQRRPLVRRFTVCETCQGNRLLRALHHGRAVLIPCGSCQATGRTLLP